ncbi:MAG TPA: hypothetical protein VIY73_03385 [Polyangiaceae bacterium]
MQPLKAQVHNGRLVLDEPTDLPEGEVVYLQPLDAIVPAHGDDLDDVERAALHRELDASMADLQPVDAALDEEYGDEERAQLRRALDESIAQGEAGQTIDVVDTLAELRAHR